MWDNNGNSIKKIYDPDTGRELRSFNNGDHAVAFSPDGRRILTASESFRLKIGDTTYAASYAAILDAATGRKTGVIGYGPLNVGAKAFADLQIARFLGDTAAAGRHEAVLQFITGRGDATRAEVEAFYRANVRDLIAGVVDREFTGVTVPAATVTHVKSSLANFFTTPNQANFNTLKDIYSIYRLTPEILQQRYDNNMENARRQQEAGNTELSESFRRGAISNQDLLNTIRRTINAPNNAPVDWSGFQSAYYNILDGLNTMLVKNM
jgi:hypothetical protein